MGYGYWTRESFADYSAARGRAVDTKGNLDSRLTDQQLFVQRGLHPRLNPYGVNRECCDSADHPETVPVILALDVTGSMGPAAAEVARKMNEVMTSLYGRIPDVEFLVMGIGDLSYDRAPIQMSQFEADIRVAEQLDLVYMEHGGGGNSFESYTAAWYMASRHTRLDCWKRGKKGLLITMGDEPLNPYLPAGPLAAATGDRLQGDVDTAGLYRETAEKYEIFHMHVTHRQYDRHLEEARRSFGKILPPGRLILTDLQGIAGELVNAVTAHAERNAPAARADGIRWDAGETPAPGTAPGKAGKHGLGRIFSW